MPRHLLGRLATLVVALTFCLSLLPTAAAQTRPYADPAFQKVWERYDRPVEVGFTKRSWTWGPNTPFNGYEVYKEAKDDRGQTGRRIVQYFDKTRMEINDPSGDRDNPFFVTNGLLVRELVAGRIATGNTDTEAREPANEAVTGDPAVVNDDAATYTTFREVASLNNDRRADRRVGEKVTSTIDKAGRVRSLPSEQQSLGELARIAVYEETLGHNIPDKFWDFLNQKGMVYENEKFVPEATVYQPWVYAMGVPITEPYWTTTKVGSVDKWVLVQLYERRALTFTPGNPVGFEVEMGNVGQHYYRWRYQIPVEDETDPDARPRILNIERTSLTPTSARIEWTTSRATTTELAYGTSTSNRTVVGNTTTYRTDHAVDLTGLTPNTVYYFRVVSRDRDGRIVDDSDHSFKTPLT